MGYIYKITNDINNKVYIGQTNRTIEKRWSEHLLDSTYRMREHRPLYNAMNKYGKEHFMITPIEKCSNNKLNDREIFYIAQYNTYKNGYNATIGGGGKTYYDYDKVCESYLIHKNMEKVAEIFNCDPTTVSSIVKAKGFKIVSGAEHVKEIYSQKVKCIELEKVFSSLGEATKFLRDNNYSQMEERSLRNKISAVCRKERKSVCGFTWEYIDKAKKTHENNAGCQISYINSTPKETIKKYVKESTSYTQVLHKLGYTNGNKKPQIEKYCIENNVDTSHF